MLDVAFTIANGWPYRIVDECEQKDTISKYEIAELEQVSLDLSGRVSCELHHSINYLKVVEVRLRNVSKVQPELTLLEDESTSVQQAMKCTSEPLQLTMNRWLGGVLTRSIHRQACEVYDRDVVRKFNCLAELGRHNESNSQASSFLQKQRDVCNRCIICYCRALAL